MASLDQAWRAVGDAQPTATIRSLIDDGGTDRLALLVRHQAGIRFDWTKTRLDARMLDAFARLADSAGLDAHRRALFAGEVVNPSEGRAAEHPAQRGEGNADSVQLARAMHNRMRALVDAIEAGAFGDIRHILHLGIGGSALGPALLIDALGRNARRYDVRVVSNIDGAALAAAVRGFDPAATLVAVASKTFTTTETLLNAQSALQWMTDGGVDDPLAQFIALTAAPDKAVEWGIDETRILPFSENVGGRYSLWSSIGFPVAVGLGWNAFEELLEGAALMDRHFRLTPWRDNVAVLAAFADLLHAQVEGCATRAVFAYDERLRLLPSYLQQLEMESNGKRVTADGQPLGRASAPVTWGGVGTDAQHAVFQLLHQGTQVVPVEFIAAIEPGHDFAFDHHAMLLGNCIAQGAALMDGRARPDDLARDYPGDRPSTTLLLSSVDPATIGALIAFYEHRTFANAIMLGINPFDQFGVELGKEMAKAIDAGDAQFDAATKALLDAAFGEGDSSDG